MKKYNDRIVVGDLPDARRQYAVHQLMVARAKQKRIATRAARPRTLRARWSGGMAGALLTGGGAPAGGGKLIIPDPAVCKARAAKLGRMGVYNADSRDWVASMALVEKLYPDYKT